MSLRSNEPSWPRSKQELVGCMQLLLWSVENTNVKNSKSQYTQEHERSQNEHRKSHIRDVTEDPKLGTYSDRGFWDFLLLINILHINIHVCSHAYIYVCIYTYACIYTHVYDYTYVWWERCLLITESPKTPGHYRYLIWVLVYIPYMGLAPIHMYVCCCKYWCSFTSDSFVISGVWESAFPPILRVHFHSI